jgi:hypothetical protein
MIFVSVQAALERWCEPAHPVQIVVKKLHAGILGRCRLVDNKKFVIDLSKEMGAPQAVDVLCHEWAHALSWNYMHAHMAKNAGSHDEFEWAVHDEAWGCAYSKVYRAYLDAVDLAAVAENFKHNKELRTAALNARLVQGHRKRGLV